MKDYLSDILAHTLPVGIEQVRIKGTIKETSLTGFLASKTVIMNGNFKQPCAAFEGDFGLPDLKNLNVIVGIEEYKEDALITLSMRDHNGSMVKDGLDFENKSGDFKNKYRFLGTAIAAAKIPIPTTTEPTWDISFQPTVASIQRFKSQASASPGSEYFTVRGDGGNISIFFGDPSTHQGSFVLNSSAGGFVGPYLWPTADFISVLSLQGDKMIYMSNEALLKITVDSGLIEYTYLLPALSK